MNKFPNVFRIFEILLWKVVRIDILRNGELASLDFVLEIYSEH